MRLIVSVAAVMFVIASLLWTSQSALACDAPNLLTGDCEAATDGQVTDTDATVTASQVTPAKDPSTSTKVLPRHDRTIRPTDRAGRIIVTTQNGRVINLDCIDAANCKPRPPLTVTQTTPGHGPVTLADIATFHPVNGSTQLEPNGWAIIGLDLNPYSSATRHVVTGALLDRPAEVRFTPTTWLWDYGDGATRESTVPGSPWKALSAKEFSRTATSHAYDRAGDYVITTSIRFIAEYRFDGGAWVAIDGDLGVADAPVPVVVERASTVLAGSDCMSDSSAPGC